MVDYLDALDRAGVPREDRVLGDVAHARAVGRPRVADPYLHLTNHIANLKRSGWSDADVVHGDAQTVAAGLAAHLDAGADHVCAQILVADDDDHVPALRALGEALTGSRSRAG